MAGGRAVVEDPICDSFSIYLRVKISCAGLNLKVLSPFIGQEKSGRTVKGRPDMFNAYVGNIDWLRNGR